jgi:3-dehydroshikimate dehydratase
MPLPAPPLIPGLVSITFRQLSVPEIVSLAVECGLQSIEWGGDIHVPAGELHKAKEARRICDEAGISISAYGSYYRAGCGEKNGADFGRIVETACELGTDSIRVWAGDRGSKNAPPRFRDTVIADIKRICGLAADAQLSISLEFHGGTLTDSAQFTYQLISEIAAPNLSTYWQPPVGMLPADCMESLQTVHPSLRNLHVFHWWPDHGHRLPLADGVAAWREYFKLVADPNRPRHVSLEFVRGDDPDQLREDAKTLLGLLKEIG